MGNMKRDIYAAVAMDIEHCRCAKGCLKLLAWKGSSLSAPPKICEQSAVKAEMCAGDLEASLLAWCLSGWLGRITVGICTAACRTPDNKSDRKMQQEGQLNRQLLGTQRCGHHCC
jgi:hypothetical protein